MSDSKRRMVAYFVIVMIYIVVLLPYLISISYSLPSADDFVVSRYPQSHVINAINTANQMWLGWGGGWFYAFLQALFNPLSYTNISSPLLGVAMICSFLLFLSSFSFFNIIFIRNILKVKNQYAIWLGNIFLISLIIFADNYQEVFYWYIGSIYSWGMDFFLMAISFMILHFSDKNKRLQYIMMVVTGMIACNLTVNCVAVGGTYCAIALICLINEKSKITAKEIIPLVLYVIVGCLTVVAPGNFVRKSSVGEIDTGILSIVKSCIKYVLMRSGMLTRKGVLVYMLLIMFLVGLTVGSKVQVKNNKLWIALPVGIINTFGTALPVSIGYNGGNILANRICFLLDFHMIMSSAVFLLWTGMFFAEKTELHLNSKTKLLIGILLVCFFYCFAVKDGSYRECEWDNQIRNIAKVRLEHAMWVNIFDTLEVCSDEDIRIIIPETEYIISGILYPPRISKNPDYWVNKAVATYYGFDSVAVETE